MGTSVWVAMSHCLTILILQSKLGLPVWILHVHRSTQPGDPSCKLCGAEQESPEHFLLQCSALTDSRCRHLANAPSSLSNVSPEVFYDFILGSDWLIDDSQRYVINFAQELRVLRNELSVNPAWLILSPLIRYGYSPNLEVTKKKKKHLPDVICGWG